MDAWYFDEKSNEWKVDVDKFIDSLGNLEELSANSLMIRISALSEEDVDKILKKENIRTKLSIGLLEEFKKDFYAGFEKMTRYFSTSQILSIFDVKILKSFFTGENKGHEYKLFATLLDKDINWTIRYVLNNDEMFNELFRLNDDFYSLFPNLDYDLFRDVILKMGDNISNYPSHFLGVVSDECQRKILKENISDKALIYMLPRFRNEVISEFFCEDVRARYLLDKFNIKDFVLRGIKFDDEIVKKKEFFDMLKQVDFALFRSVINEAEKNNNVDIIERRVHAYSDEIINSYDKETGVFKEYLEIINNPDFVVSYRNRSYIVDDNIALEIGKYKEWDSNGNRIISDREGLMSFLRDLTSKKLSEVIVDALFEDNIYNVWLNIREMLRYNSMLSDDKKVIDNEREALYRMILDIDNVSSEEKISLFNKLRDKKTSFMFYDDLRKLKDLSYDLIKEELFSVSDERNASYVDAELTSKYGVKVYDMQDREYTMLIRGEGMHRDKDRYRRNCYSIIGNDNSSSYGDGEYLFYYGYNSFDNDKVIHVLEQDSFSGDAEGETPSKYVNRIMTRDEIVRGSTWYSEIDLVNVKGEDGKYIAKKPDYLVVYDNISETNVTEAKRLGIPIVIINEKKLDNDKKVDTSLDRDKDYYVNYSDDELWRLRAGKAR